jgi:hypothetical protein
MNSFYGSTYVSPAISFLDRGGVERTQRLGINLETGIDLETHFFEQSGMRLSSTDESPQTALSMHFLNAGERDNQSRRL